MTTERKNQTRKITSKIRNTSKVKLWFEFICYDSKIIPLDLDIIPTCYAGTNFSKLMTLWENWITFCLL